MMQINSQMKRYKVSRAGASVSMEFGGVPGSQHVDAVTKPEALRAPWFRVVMEGPFGRLG